MKQHQIIELLHKVVAENQNFTTWTVSTPHLVALVTHVIEAEREACAEICDESMKWHKGRLNTLQAQIAATCASSIRARGDI